MLARKLLSTRGKCVCEGSMLSENAFVGSLHYNMKCLEVTVGMIWCCRMKLNELNLEAQAGKCAGFPWLLTLVQNF